MSTPKILITLVLLVQATAGAYAQAPAWWGTRNVTNGAGANDYAVANQGQAKHIATMAFAEFDAVLANPLSSTLTSLINGLVNGGNYQLLNQGQLKALAAPFYDELRNAGIWPVYGYPWDYQPAPASDHALANIGQLKQAFSFDPVNASTSPDADGDDLSDHVEHLLGTHPNLADTDGDGISDGDEVTAGSNPLDSTEVTGAASFNLTFTTPEDGDIIQ